MEKYTFHSIDWPATEAPQHVQPAYLGHFESVIQHWEKLQAHLANKTSAIIVDGHTISLADVVAVAGYGMQASLTSEKAILANIDGSLDVLAREIQAGAVIYGVNTGYGGSADVRTTHLTDLQTALVQHLNVGLLLPSDKGLSSEEELHSNMRAWRSHALPTSIVRAMMLIRSNSLARGHSGVRKQVISGILELLNRNLTPVIPLRGSISASGDLSSLSYIAGALEGNPDVYLRHKDGADVIIKPSDQVLHDAGIATISLQAKEGLGITNGTAASTATASLALVETNQLAILAQLLTAFATEALLGTNRNYSAFISSTRPHPGQAEAASNITEFLRGSKLATDTDPAQRALAQDRYPLRTAPQWLGPLLENLVLANEQITKELNSTTDNPLIDISTNSIHHGGNFQAASVTSAMEKAAGVLQNIAKLLFAGCSELLNMSMNRGLPPNLSADDPSTSFTMKGLDVNMAAYMTEVAHLAHPVSNFVQSTEMHNQSINSMALLAARVALESAELVSLMAATYIYALCQAVDLRCLHLEFLWSTEPVFQGIIKDLFSEVIPADRIGDLSIELWSVLIDRWIALVHLDLSHRATETAQEAFGLSLLILERYHQNQPDGAKVYLNILELGGKYREVVGKMLIKAYTEARSKFFILPTTSMYLSPVTNTLYKYVRQDLGVPMHRGLIDHPRSGFGANGSGKIIGSLVSDIYVSLRNGKLYDHMMSMLAASESAEVNPNGAPSEHCDNIDRLQQPSVLDFPNTPDIEKINGTLAEGLVEGII